MITTTNFQGATVIKVPSTRESGEGAICVPFDKFRETVGLLSGTLTIEMDSKFRLSINGTQVQMVGESDENFPDIPDQLMPIFAIDDVSGFRKALARTVSAASKKLDTLKGVAMVLSGEKMELMAADGTLAVIEQSVVPTFLSPTDTTRVFIPSESVGIASSFSAERIEVAINEARGQLFLSGNNSYVVVRTADYKFNENGVRNAMPNPEITVSVNAKEFDRVYRLAGIFSDRIKDNEAVLIVLEWDETSMEVRSFRKKKGSQGASSTIPAVATGKGSITLNANQTVNIGHIVSQGENLVIGIMENKTKPYLITSPEIPGFLSFIMPINISE